VADLTASYRILINKEFKRRCEKNLRYSQNAFAKYLGLNSTYMSKLLKGKILLSLNLAERIMKKLNLSESEEKEFLLSVAEEQKCHALYLINPSLTECDPENDESNFEPKPRKKLRKI
jgi:transcriptional regulator with XRE-family HTH domain